jgi:hypothetical protein
LDFVAAGFVDASSIADFLLLLFHLIYRFTQALGLFLNRVTRIRSPPSIFVVSISLLAHASQLGLHRVKTTPQVIVWIDRFLGHGRATRVSLLNGPPFHHRVISDPSFHEQPGITLSGAFS